MYKKAVLNEGDIIEYLNKAYYEGEYELDNIAYKGNDTYLIVLKRFFK